MRMELMSPGDMTRMRGICEGIVAGNNADGDARSNLTEQIHEMFFNSEISDVCIPNVLDHYVVIRSDGLEPLRVAFEGLDNENTVIMIKTRMSCARWDITFRFRATKLKTMAQVYEMSTMGVVMRSKSTSSDRFTGKCLSWNHQT
jgi:hypothetical protein